MIFKRLVCSVYRMLPFFTHWFCSHKTKAHTPHPPRRRLHDEVGSPQGGDEGEGPRQQHEGGHQQQPHRKHRHRHEPDLRRDGRHAGGHIIVVAPLRRRRLGSPRGAHSRSVGPSRGRGRGGRNAHSSCAFRRPASDRTALGLQTRLITPVTRTFLRLLIRTRVRQSEKVNEKGQEFVLQFEEEQVVKCLIIQQLGWNSRDSLPEIFNL